MNHFAGIIALACLLAGCASSASGPKFVDSSYATQAVAADKARIIFYREDDRNFRAAGFGIDGNTVGSPGHRQFMVADVTPGDHTLTAWARLIPGEYPLEISVSAGETYYVRASRRPEKAAQAAAGPAAIVFLFVDRKGDFKLELVPSSIALIDLEELKTI